MPNDLHTIAAAKMFNINPEQVTKQQRDFAKNRTYVELYSSPMPKLILKAKYV
jgi:DNA polymerase I-like protein with 3'-5' exonuclease and polymerase domains